MARAFSEQIKTSIGLAREEAQKKLTVKLGKIVGEGKANYRYDVVINGELIPEVPDPSRTEPKYVDGTAVNIVIPFGNESARYISDKSDYTLPKQTISYMSTKKKEKIIVPENIYLSDPYSEKIKIYSLAGVAGEEINLSWMTDNLYCTDGTSIYSGDNILGFKICKVEITGELTQIINTGGSIPAVSLTVKPDSTYLYALMGADGDNHYIARINISAGTVEREWLLAFSDDPESVEYYYISGNDSYLCVTLDYEYISSNKILIYDYSGNLVKEIEFTETEYHFRGIHTTDTKIYIVSRKAGATRIEVYDFSGNLLFSGCDIVNPIYAVTTDKDDNIYTVSYYSYRKYVVKKYNSSGVFQSEFIVDGTIVDAVIV